MGPPVRACGGECPCGTEWGWGWAGPLLCLGWESRCEGSGPFCFGGVPLLGPGVRGRDPSALGVSLSWVWCEGLGPLYFGGVPLLTLK